MNNAESGMLGVDLEAGHRLGVLRREGEFVSWRP